MRIRVLAAVLLAAVFCAVRSEAADLADGTYAFNVIRKGDQIGTHTVTARHEGEDLVLDIAVDIKVKIAFVTAYRYEQKRHEVWRGGRLIAFESDTNDDGKKAKTSGKAEGDKLVVEGPGGKQELPGGLLSNSYWSAELVKQTELLNSFDSSVLKVAVKDMGEEGVETAKGTVRAHRYALTGDLERELWYDAEGRWVHMRTTRGGTPVDWVLQ